ncbi:MAG: hypothetical protein H7Y14_08750 [Burkholderiales bacterium]|nr:hypothetical protein [Burkholderiales bacterium]
MDPTASIRKLGFRRWYERQLIDCHAALVTCFLCGLTIAVLLEQVNLVDFGWRPLMMLMIVLAAGLLGWYAFRRYITVLQRAERYGERSNCPGCKEYGRFVVEATGMDQYPDAAARAVAPLESAWLRVRCKKCETVWRMPD